MALSWLSALKAVPWADVVQAAPAIVQGARKLFTAAKSYAGATANDTRAQEKPVQRMDFAGRVLEIEQTIATLQAEQRASAELIRSLAEQNANIVAALDQLRRRIRVLSVLSVLLVLVLGILAAVVIARL